MSPQRRALFLAAAERSGITITTCATVAPQVYEEREESKRSKRAFRKMRVDAGRRLGASRRTLDYPAIIAMFEKGMSARAVAKELGRHWTTIKYIRQNYWKRGYTGLKRGRPAKKAVEVAT